jgi:hypothetical protein
VERFFRDLTENRLRRGAFRNIEELITAIDEYIGAMHPRIPRDSASRNPGAGLTRQPPPFVTRIAGVAGLSGDARPRARYRCLCVICKTSLIYNKFSTSRLLAISPSSAEMMA